MLSCQRCRGVSRYHSAHSPPTRSSRSTMPLRYAQVRELTSCGSQFKNPCASRSSVIKVSGSMEYEAVIGLETHVQLKTRSKMWCGCANEFGAPPNTNVCPVCLGLPGVLPVANEEALRLTALTGFLLNGTVSSNAKFDRKNYFYPDMPKNYQITQC